MVLACATGAGAQTITVTTTRNPVDKSYRNMLQGMDLFEAMRAMAPNASLRYKLLPMQRGTDMDGIVLEIVGHNDRIRVPLAPDRTFTLERHQKALDEDASVMPNRRERSMTWRTEIRTPDLPPNTRRLGDLRLECHVGMEADLVSKVGFFAGLVSNPALRRMGFCGERGGRYYFFSDHALFSVTMVAGTRREILSVDALYAGQIHDPQSEADLSLCDCQALLDRTYFMPLGDRSWPDDTLIEFEYMDGAAHSASDAITVGKSTRADVMAARGKTAGISFDSGFEVWVYQVPGDAPAKRSREKPVATELVVLFAPSGVVAKTRIRLPPPPREAKGP